MKEGIVRDLARTQRFWGLELRESTWKRRTLPHSYSFEGRVDEPCLLLVDRPEFARWIRSLEGSMQR